MRILPKPIAFEWDAGNIGKNKRHHVEEKECEEAFLDENKVIFKDVLHSDNEERFRVIGKTRHGRLLFVVFTVRGDTVRIISARDTNRKELPIYEKAT